MKTFRKYFFKLVLFIEKIYRTGFNKDLGYYYFAKIFYRDGIPQIGYIIFRKEKFFWMVERYVVDAASSLERLNKKKEELLAQGKVVHWV